MQPLTTAHGRFVKSLRRESPFYSMKPETVYTVRITLEQPAYVPYRALIAPDWPNLLVAGRCISTDRRALASLRVQASCMGTGQAAGVAAAHSIREGVSVQSVDTDALIATLRDWGAVI